MPGKQPHYRIGALVSQHDRAGFSCGSPQLDSYLATQARQDAKRHVAAPFVLFDEADYVVLGYYTLSSISIDIGSWPDDVARKLPRYPQVPATLLGRLAVHSRLQGTGMGEYLLMDALRRSWEQSGKIASTAVIVDAKDEKAAAFYAHYEFRGFEDMPNRLFLPMGTIRRLFED